MGAWFGAAVFVVLIAGRRLDELGITHVIVNEGGRLVFRDGTAALYELTAPPYTPCQSRVLGVNS